MAKESLANCSLQFPIFNQIMFAMLWTIFGMAESAVWAEICKTVALIGNHDALTNNNIFAKNISAKKDCAKNKLMISLICPIEN